MADLDFENPTFDPDGSGIDDDYSFDLPDAIMDPPLRVQQDLNTSGDHIQRLANLTSIDDRKSEVERHLAREHRKLTETDDTEMKKEIETESESSRVYYLTSSLRDRQGSKPSLRTGQPSVLRSTESLRHSGGSTMKTPHWLGAFAPCYVSKELPITMASILTAIGMAISTLVLALTGGGGSAPALTGGGGSAPVPAPEQPDKSGLKEWVKKHQQALGRALANLADKAAAALPGITGSILALEYIGKDCDLTRRKFVVLGHCCGDPASRGCSGLASEMITKAQQGHPLSQRPQGPFFLLHGPSRSAVPPLTCRRCQLRYLSTCSAAPCERSRLVRQSSLGMPYRLWRRSALSRLSQGCVR